MISAGCDLGAAFTKVVLMGEDRLLGSRVLRSSRRVVEQVPGILAELQREARVRPGEIAFLGATGSGAGRLEGADFLEDELVCVAAAVSYLAPGVDLVLHAGAQSTAALTIGSEGQVLSLARNDKCASGTGRFLEMMGGRLGVSMERMDSLAAEATGSIEVSSQCVVFAESEVISQINAQTPLPELVAGICTSMGRMVASLSRRSRGARRCTVTGGVARMESVLRVVRSSLCAELVPFPCDPMLAAALGAALLEEE